MENRNWKSGSGRRHLAFTLVELLVVIGIIVLLVGILMPVVEGVRRNAAVADQKAQINRLISAIESYQVAFRAYPGPVSNAAMYGGGGPVSGMTDSENLLLGLLGGLKQTGGAVAYDPGILNSQQGPFGLNPAASRGPSQSFITLKPDELSSGNTNLGSAIPEVMDRFGGSGNQVLYFRASNGSAGVVNDTGSTYYQYDIRRNSVYTTSTTYNHTHGLRTIGSAMKMEDVLPKGTPAPALPYFTNQLNPGANNATGNARAKDGYMLISAGADEIYGTADDICSFGAVRP